jgi:hypothetical protein
MTTIYLCSKSAVKEAAVLETLKQWGCSRQAYKVRCISPPVETTPQPLNDEGTRVACLSRLRSVYEKSDWAHMAKEEEKQHIILLSIENGIYLKESCDKAILACVVFHEWGDLIETPLPWEDLVVQMVYSEAVSIPESTLFGWISACLDPKKQEAAMTFGAWFSKTSREEAADVDVIVPADDWYQALNAGNKSRQELLSEALSRLFLFVL